jgi:hypothetical protein
MAAFFKFEPFVEALAHGKHALDTDVLKIYLSTAVPSVTDGIKDDLAELTVGVDGYTAGGVACAVVSSAQVDGVYTLVLESPDWESTGTLGPFRSAVLYNSSTVDEDLIGAWDYGSNVTLSNGDFFAVFLDETNGVLTLE